MTYAEKMLSLCPRHSRKGWHKRGFRCVCREMDAAFTMGYRSVRQGRRT